MRGAVPTRTAHDHYTITHDMNGERLADPHAVTQEQAERPQSHTDRRRNPTLPKPQRGNCDVRAEYCEPSIGYDIAS